MARIPPEDVRRSIPSRGAKRSCFWQAGGAFALMTLASAAFGEETQTWKIEAAPLKGFEVSATSTDGDRLTIGCVPAAKSSWVGFRPARPRFSDDDDVIVRYKVDAKRSIRLEFAKDLSTGSILEGGAASAMIAGIAAATKRVTYQDEQTLARFDTTGLDSARRHLATNCPHLGL